MARVAHVTNRAAAGGFGKWTVMSLPSPTGLVVRKGQGTIPRGCFLPKLFDSVSLGLSEQVFLSYFCELPLLGCCLLVLDGHVVHLTLSLLRPALSLP